MQISILSSALSWNLFFNVYRKQIIFLFNYDFGCLISKISIR